MVNELIQRQMVIVPLLQCMKVSGGTISPSQRYSHYYVCPVCSSVAYLNVSRCVGCGSLFNWDASKRCQLTGDKENNT